MKLISNDLPDAVSTHLQTFLINRPDWSEQRILQSALALFLLQNGVNDQGVSQAYLQAMFPKHLQVGGAYHE